MRENKILSDILAHMKLDGMALSDVLTGMAAAIISGRRSADKEIKEAIEAERNEDTSSRIVMSQSAIGMSSDGKRLKLEQIASSMRMAEIMSGRHKIVPTYDLEHLKALHERLHADVYQDAGKIRTNDTMSRGMLVLQPQYIKEKVSGLSARIWEKKLLAHVRTLDEMAKELSWILCELIVAMPFNIGTGRVARLFINDLAERNDFGLNWKMAGAAEMSEAAYQSLMGDYDPMNALIRKIIYRNLQPQPELERDLMPKAENDGPCA